jgi:adenylyltransferase/sulfurtransferase
LFPDAEEGVIPNCAEAGVLVVLPGVMGTIQATEAIKLIAGIGEPLIGRLLTYDALDLHFEEFRFARREDCAVCGEHPSITEPQEPSMNRREEPLSGIRRITPRELRASLESASAGSRPYLVDVREPYEFEAGHLEGSLHIPLSDLPRRIGEIPRDSSPVFICRVGGRSITACSLALRAGIESPANLEGGLLAWARDVDPDLDVA